MIEYIDKWLFNVIKIIVVLVLTLFVLNQVGLWMENKGWIYYKNKSSSGNLGNALLNIEAIINPKAIYVIEAKQKRIAAVVKRETDKNKVGVIIEKLNKTTNERQFEFILSNSNLNSISKNRHNNVI